MAGDRDAGSRGCFAGSPGPRGPADGVLYRNDGMGSPNGGPETFSWTYTKKFAARPEALPFLRGGIWRNFFTKYSESNLLHKKMLHVSGKVKKLSDTKSRSRNLPQARDEASTLLLQGQCNDAYWHGVFGGLYAPHLRTALWRSLVQAETIADGLEHRKHEYAEFQTLDFDADGREEVYFTSEKYAALVAPGDGGTISAIDFRPANATPINSLMRRTVRAYCTSP